MWHLYSVWNFCLVWHLYSVWNFCSVWHLHSVWNFCSVWHLHSVWNFCSVWHLHSVWNFCSVWHLHSVWNFCSVWSFCYMERFHFNNTPPSSERGPRFLIVGRKRVSAYDLWQCPCYRFWQKKSVKNWLSRATFGSCDAGRCGAKHIPKWNRSC